MQVEKLFNRITTELKEYCYLCFNMDCKSDRLENYSLNVDVSYNKTFSENIRFIVKNQRESILSITTINIKDLDYMKNKLIQEVF